MSRAPGVVVKKLGMVGQRWTACAVPILNGLDRLLVEGHAAEEPEDDEHAKDGVSLDELFSMKPEIFQTPAGEEDESADKKKGKKGKKKSVALEFDEERGEVVARKKHKRGDDIFGEDE